MSSSNPKKRTRDADASSNGDGELKRVATGGSGAGAGAGSGDVDYSTREGFLAMFEELNKQLCDEILPKYEMVGEPVEWIRRMTAYTVPGGKLNRGLTVVHAVQAIRGAAATQDELRRAAVLGWCIEWLQACFLVADDVMDASVTRRGAPCWYKQDDVKLIAINDAFILRSSLLMFMKAHFRDLPYYGRLLDLFNETTFQTELGQLLDLTSAPIGGPVDFTRFTVARHTLIVKYKTSFYSFYLPIAAAMLITGETDDAAYDEAKGILTDMGVYFQVQDDYLDCYGDPAVIGKVGTDIQDNKCGWLIVQALEHPKLTEDQRATLAAHYGVDDEASIQKVKDVYVALELEKLYLQYEADAYKSVSGRIASLKSSTPPAVFTALLDKIFKRKK